MSETSGAVTTSGVVILEEPEVGGASGGRQGGERAGALRCAFWPRQQTWLCVVPLLIGFVGLGLSLMLLKWIVVGSVQDYVPTDLVGAKGIGQDPFSLAKPSALPKGPDSTTSSTTTTTVSSTISTITTAVRGKTRTTAPPNLNPRDGGSSGSQVTQKTTTTTAFGTASPVQTSTSSPSSSKPTVLNDSTREHSTTERPVNNPAQTHISRKTPAPTLPPLKSEHFKPCQEKDLAYCLNDGECFVIETLSGPHKHCRCKEGFQGIRCDQFLPKTDSILSDPIDHLGIEFMESEEVYKRQVLSITCIAMGISFLGTLCMALYCRNKRRREKLQAHLKESRGLKNYSIGQPCKAHPSLQLHNYCKSTKTPLHGGSVHESVFSQSSSMTSSFTRGLTTTRHHRSSSVLCNGEAKNRPALRISTRRTPPIPSGRLNPITGSKDSGPAYQHLQEADGSERDVEPARVNVTKPDGTLLHQDTFQGMQASQSCQIWAPPRNLCFGSPRKRSPAPYRIPIIPSVHSHQDETSCMQTTCADGMNRSFLHQGGTGSTADNPVANPVCNRVGEKRKEGACLAEEAREKFRASANGKQDDTMFTASHVAKETVCILRASGTGHGNTAPSGPTETQLLDPRDMHEDSTQPRQ
ncbi:pro-neuregulin-3, membrane-bound isoform isoform X2 [Silurus meridionalis]|uniref:pro-neuregulin-3, membrane-bound isoform isoform X2 n=1 Tax=Silurus meridionalis TaxID=175797 RepID=UPI001EEB8623|nr:pro-neuregulin-3, membrane-bound isoform isoform X2 [Silurus meridionalis]